MPYGNSYTYQPTDGGAPDQYVYYPTVGWMWVVAPWIWGWGPQPYWGIYGYGRYGWYGYGYGHWYGYRGAYANYLRPRVLDGRPLVRHAHGAVPYHPAGPGMGAGASRSGYVTARGAYAAPRAGYAAPRTAYAAPHGGYAAPRGGMGGAPSAAGHAGGSFGGHATGWLRRKSLGRLQRWPLRWRRWRSRWRRPPLKRAPWTRAPAKRHQRSRSSAGAS